MGEVHIPGKFTTAVVGCETLTETKNITYDVKHDLKCEGRTKQIMKPSFTQMHTA